jgi:threonine/homoserine/homoserine lactone efflux protein
MPEPLSIGLFVASALLLLVVPGPAVLYIIGRSMHQGRCAGLISVLGICTGTMCHVVAAAIGLTAALRASPVAFSTVRYAGAAYLAYLGLHAIRNGEPHDGGSPAQSKSTPMQIFRDGVLVNVLNPKTALFFLAFLPQFVDQTRGTITGQVLLLGGLFVFLSLVSDSAYAFLAGTLGECLQRHSQFRRAMPYMTGGIFLTLGVLAALT